MRTSRSICSAWIALLALAFAATPAAAKAGSPAGKTGAAGGVGSLDARIDQAVERITPALIEVRHKIHQNPELGNKETATAALVAERLRALGFEVRTGV